MKKLFLHILRLLKNFWFVILIFFAISPLYGLGITIIMTIISLLFFCDPVDVSELKSNFTKRELAIVSATEINEKVSDDVYLSTLARYQSFFAPKKVGKGLTWTSSELQSDAYVFNYERKNFDGFSLSKMKEDILSQLDKRSVHVQRLIRSNRNLIFRYTSRQTGESVDITINKEDLK